MVRRWQQLPLDHALSSAPVVRRLLDDLAAPAGPVPDLGPAVLMDQLTVLVYDACARVGRRVRRICARLAGPPLRTTGLAAALITGELSVQVRTTRLVVGVPQLRRS